jgi:hypothetical protein
MQYLFTIKMSKQHAKTTINRSNPRQDDRGMNDRSVKGRHRQAHPLARVQKKDA